MLGARAPTQPVGLACADQNTFQAALDKRTCGYGFCVRRIQYIRIASFARGSYFGDDEVLLMTAGESTPCGKSGSNRTAILAASGPGETA